MLRRRAFILEHGRQDFFFLSSFSSFSSYSFSSFSSSAQRLSIDDKHHGKSLRRQKNKRKTEATKRRRRLELRRRAGRNNLSCILNTIQMSDGDQPRRRRKRLASLLLFSPFEGRKDETKILGQGTMENEVFDHTIPGASCSSSSRVSSRQTGVKILTSVISSTSPSSIPPQVLNRELTSSCSSSFILVSHHAATSHDLTSFSGQIDLSPPSLASFSSLSSQSSRWSRLARDIKKRRRRDLLNLLFLSSFFSSSSPPSSPSPSCVREGGGDLESSVESSAFSTVSLSPSPSLSETSSSVSRHLRPDPVSEPSDLDISEDPFSQSNGLFSLLSSSFSSASLYHTHPEGMPLSHQQREDLQREQRAPTSLSLFFERERGPRESHDDSFPTRRRPSLPPHDGHLLLNLPSSPPSSLLSNCRHEEPMAVEVSSQYDTLLSSFSSPFSFQHEERHCSAPPPALSFSSIPPVNTDDSSSGIHPSSSSESGTGFPGEEGRSSQRDLIRTHPVRNEEANSIPAEGSREKNDRQDVSSPQNTTSHPLQSMKDSSSSSSSSLPSDSVERQTSFYAMSHTPLSADTGKAAGEGKRKSQASSSSSSLS
ncbi:hypothetical protein CSUI_000664, partial [Cystoisospora suis]